MTAREEADELLRRAEQDVAAHLAAIRNDALEEAARVCEVRARAFGQQNAEAVIALNWCTDFIRALKSQEPSRLIAAAPALLEALDGLMRYFNSANGVPVERATIRAESSEVQAARAAIAAAKGE